MLESGGGRLPTIDLVLREVGAIKLGTFELLDLIGLDVNLMVTKSVWNAYYQDSRFRPSLTQEEMVAARLKFAKVAAASTPTRPSHCPAPRRQQARRRRWCSTLPNLDALDPLIERIRRLASKVQSRKE